MAKEENKKEVKKKTVKKQPTSTSKKNVQNKSIKKETTELKKAKVDKKELQEKELKNKMPEEENDNKRKYIIIILLLLLLCIFGISITFGKDIYDAVSEQVIEVLNLNKPTAPKITGGSEKWSKERLIRVEKDSEAKDGLAYYEYCINKDDNTKNCEWKKIETKNVKVVKSGKYYVTFRAVDKEERRGYNSNTEVVYIDNNNPIIKNVEIKETTENSVKIEVKAKDEHSGIEKYLYSLDGKNYEEGKKNYTYSNLEKNKEYTIYIKVHDKVGNITTLSIIVKTSTGESNNSCILNCDINNNGKCDLNCDTDGDGKADTNLDTDNDGDCDKNCTDKEYETEEKDKCILNCDTNNNGKCDLNCDTDGDGKADTNLDTDNDGECDKNCTDKEADIDSGVTPKPTPDVPTKPEVNPDDDNDDQDKDEENEKEELEIPEINLNEVPSEFIYGSKFELPSYVSFGKDTGTYECIVAGKEYTDTSTLPIGKHLIVCNATSSKNIRVMVEKEVTVKVEEGEEEVWDGWIRLNLYYPENSTNWEWRLNKEGNINTGYNNTDWQAYTGPILVNIDDVDDIYIRYDINGETYVIAPNGKVAVSIEPKKFTLAKEEKTKVNIYYDKEAITKEYRIDGGEWQQYKGTFEVGKNTIVEARAIKEEKVYDGEGNYLYTSKRSGTNSVFISEYVESSESTGGTTPGGIEYEPSLTPGGTIITSPKPSSKPTTYLEGPIISSNPSNELVESVKINVRPQEVAEKIYVSVGYGKYQEYTNEIEVTTNTIVRAYYVRYTDGKVSETSYYYVQNIKEESLPYVRINATPTTYLSEKQEKVEVTLSGSNYDKLEYSLDGVIYEPYTSSFMVTESRTVYARGTNSAGVKVEKLSIPTTTSPKVKEKLAVHIELDPDKSKVEGLVNKTQVSIAYDGKATNKYYRIGYNGEWKKYTGPFEVTNNTTVYAYCTSENGVGSTNRQINFLTTGISNPIIKANPTTATQQVKIEIDYDDKATITRYQIGNGPMLDYNGAFYVYENTTIKAYNKNSLGYEETSSYEITNITEAPKYTVLAKEKYYIIKLNYPTTSTPSGREYKWKQDGKWKQYDSKGILLIKPEYKDEIMTDSDGIEVEDENGKKIVFTDHYYLIDVPLSELAENIFMRWDLVKVKAPQILVNPIDEPTKEVEVGILYSTSLTKKYYKTITEDGKDSGWKEYTGTFTIKENNVVVYAKGITINNNDSEISSKKITNIDLIAPKVEVTGDLTTPKRQVTLRVKALDNMGIDKIRWAKGDKDTEYFKSNGTTIRNNSTITIKENGIYTIYAVDKVGNEVIKTVEVTNIDKNAPDIIINVLTESYGTEAEVSIDYGDSKTKQYRIGESSITYKTYTENIIIKSNDVLNLVNEDGSLTIYARGKDEAGNIQEVSEKIYVLDLDAPKAPVIHATSGYPILTEYGVKLTDDSYIEYDTRDDITNYYSVDNGKTWEIYTGPFEITSGTIMAKSVKKESGLTITTTKKVDMPSDALGPEAYDGNLSTSVNVENKNLMIDVSEELQNKNINVDVRFVYIDAILSDGTTKRILTHSDWEAHKIVTLPSNTIRLKITGSGPYAELYEISISTIPTITQTNIYPILTEYGVTQGYNEVTINYFQTAVQRLYRINEGEWQEYQDKAIRLDLGEKIEVKGINKYGEESELNNYTSKLPADALGVEAYDGNLSTSANVENKTLMIDVSEELQNKNINVKLRWVNIDAILSDGTTKRILTHSDWEATKKFTLPSDVIRLKITAAGIYAELYEISVSTIPTITQTNIYPILTEYGVTQGYNEVTINYFQTAVQRLYRINEGEWQEYQDKAIRLDLGEKIEVKGINKYGEESELNNYTSKLPADALGVEAYDGNLSTSANVENKTLMIDVSEELQNKNIDVKLRWVNIDAILSDGTTKRILTHSDWEANKKFTLPSDVIRLKITAAGIYAELYEISVSTIPIITQTNTYSNLSSTTFSDSIINAKINYLSYLPQKLYSIDNGKTWKEYTKPLKVNVGDVVKAKGIDKDGKETEIATYTVTAISDNLDSKAFDNNKETTVTIAKNTNKIFTLSEDTIGKDIRFFFTGTISSTATIKIYDSNNTELETINIINMITVFEVPENAYKVVVNSGSSELTVSEINIRQVKFNNNVNIPIIELNDLNWTTSKTILITYPDGYRNEYSLDLGETWQEYLSPIVVDKPLTVLARTMENGKLVSSSSFTITRIDNIQPIIKLDIPNKLLLGEEYSLPTSYKVGPSGGNPVCKIGEDVVTATKNLELGTYTIECSITNGAGITVNENKRIKVLETIEYEGDSILKILETEDLETGRANFLVNDEVYPVHLYVLDGDQHFTENKTFGDVNDVATDSTEAQNMVIVKVNGDLTVDSGVTVGPYYNNYGGPKGFTLYVTGKLTNNGIIDNSHGAKAEGQNVYLWKNADGTYEYVPATGGTGGASVTSGAGKAGTSGTGRATGGGGSGGTSNGSNKSGAGGTGTSYSGGSGGGGRYNGTATAGSNVGGAGGKGSTDGSYSASSGAGNPSGNCTTSASLCKVSPNGTGGLLTIYAKSYINNGTISANGTTVTSARYSGGSSGGGSINIFTNQSTGIDQLGIITNTRYDEIKGTTSNNGGSSVGDYPGGAGGSGTINIGEIRNGQYYDLKEVIEQDQEVYRKSVTLEGESIFSILSNENIKSGYWYLKVNGEEYSSHVYVLNGNQEWTENKVFGDENDVATASTYAQNMVIVKVNGNVTIDEGVTVGPYYTKYGGPKGLTLYVTGKLTNNGTIDNSHGAKAEGQNVYLWKNADGTYEYVPAVGATGGASVKGGAGKAGTSGTGRATGGGGSGGTSNSSNKSGAGGTGTSYSGGSGGGGRYNGTATAGSNVGGAGGKGSTDGSYSASSGAGNPAGNCTTSATYCKVSPNGTGGLLTIYAENYINNGTISASGTTVTSARYSGGSSGGGSINIFYSSSYVAGTVKKNGGSSVGTYPGGAGGAGTVTYTKLPQVSVSSAYTYPNLTSSSFDKDNYLLKINYSSALTKKLYSLDNGSTWFEYSKPLEVFGGTLVQAKGIKSDNTETDVVTYQVPTVTDNLLKESYDGDSKTIAIIPANTNNVFTLSNNLADRSIRIYLNNKPASDASIKIYDSSNNELLNTTFVEDLTVIKVPENGYKVVINSGSTELQISEINLRNNITLENQNPIIDISDTSWTVSKTIDITYPEGNYVKEYSLDMGTTWQEYLSPITVEKETTVLTRTVENGKVVSSSSFIITKIDTTEPTITLDLPDQIVLGTEYSLPTSYKVDETKSGGNAICKIGENEVTTTKNLAIGTYEITCTATTGAGKKSSVTKTLNVVDETIDITLEIPDKILVGSEYKLPTSVTGNTYSCKIGEQEVTSTKDITTGTYEIICSVTSIGGNKKEVTKQIEVYENSSTESPSGEENELTEGEENG